jgi:hypothetical protein
MNSPWNQLVEKSSGSPELELVWEREEVEFVYQPVRVERDSSFICVP